MLNIFRFQNFLISTVQNLLVTIVILFFLNYNIYSQTKEKSGFGITGGLSFSAGTHTNRVGVFLQSYSYYDFIQINLRTALNRDFTGIGACKKGFEFQANGGVLFSYGKPEDETSYFFGTTENNTYRPFSIGYSYNIYRNSYETSQATGTLGLGIRKFDIISENDIFATPASDKFRTAAIKITYTENVSDDLFGITGEKNGFKLGVNAILWTGNPRGTRRITGSSYPSQYGYREITNGKYGKFSNGILNFSGQYMFAYRQIVGANTGIDSEKIRHTLQNRLIHDVIFLPKFMKVQLNPHYPMLTDKKELYLFEKGQKIKPAKFYIKVNLNDNLFY